jgi:hypothetical protein
MPHDVFRFCVAIGNLVQKLNARHFSAAFWYLDSISQEHGHAIESMNSGKPPEYGFYPSLGKSIGISCARVKEIQDPVIKARRKSKRPDDAGHSQKIVPRACSGQCGCQPQKRLFPRTGSPHRLDP